MRAPSRVTVHDRPAAAMRSRRPCSNTRGQVQHVGVVLRGVQVLQRGLQRGQRERVARQRGADAAVAFGCGILGLRHALGHGLCEAVHRARQAPGHGFADHHEIRLQPMGSRVAAQRGGDGVGLVADEERAVCAAQRARLFPETGCGWHQAEVGERRFGQQAGHVALLQRGFQGIEVVERHDAGEVGVVVHLAQHRAARQRVRLSPGPCPPTCRPPHRGNSRRTPAVEADR